jgi:DNA polymerase-3 subunit beta
MIVLKAPQEKLLEALQSVAGIVERRHTLPILANVLLRKNGDEVEFTTSDLEIQVRTRAELGGDAGSFSTTVGARKLIDILRSLPADQVVTLSSGADKLTLQAARAASRCRPCRPTTFRWSTKRWTSARLRVPQKTLRA